MRPIRPIRLIRLLSKKLLIAILALVVIGVPLLYLTFLNSKSALAAWYDDNWAYRQTVALTNSGSAQTDYQVSITLNTSTLITAGKMQSDCDDLRVTDINGKLLPIWIEKGTNACNTSTTAIWTKAPSIPTSGATLYVYYGNPSAASVQNGDNVFIFFDDFEGGNLSKWTNTNFTASTDVANSGSYAAKVTGAISASLFRNLNSSSSLAVLLQQRAAQTNSREDPTLSYTGGVAGNRAFMNLDSDGWSYRDYYDSLGNRVSTGAFTYSANTWYRTEYMVDVSTNKLTMKVNTTTYVNNVDIQDITSIDRITFTGNASLGGTFYFDDVLVRKHSSTEPSVGSPASEEKAPSPVAYWKFDEGTGTNAQDSTSNNLDGTLNNTPTWQTEDMCVAGKCLYFNGTTNMNVSKSDDPKLDFAAADNFTVSAWVKRPQVSSANNFIITKAQTGYTGYKLYQDASGDYCFDVSDGTNTDTACTSAVEFDDSQWHLVQGVKAGTTSITLYVDGKQRAQDASVAATGTLANTGTFYVGVDLDGTSNEWLGFIDEVKVYRDNTARSAAQVLTDYSSRGSVKGASSTLGSPSAGSGQLSQGLIGYWKMDEASWNNNCSATSVIDSSGNGNNGQACPATTGPTGGATGKFGNAGSFDGSNDYVEMGNPSALQITGAMTISAWVYLSVKPAAESHIVSKLTTTRGYQFYVTSAGKLACYIAPTSSTLTGCTAGNTDILGAWHLVTLVYSPSNYLRIYVDGNLDSENTSDIPSSQYSASNNVNIGRRPDLGAGTPFNGTIDEVRIYNRALTSAEITALYNFAPGPVGYWNMDENAGTTLNDSSGNANGGVLSVGATGSQTTAGQAWKPGKYGAGLNFDGTDDSASVSNTISGVQTYEFWVNPSSATANMAALTASAYITSSSGTVSATGFTSPTIYVNGVVNGTISANTWNHVAVTTGTGISASAITFGLADSVYLNGKLDNIQIYSYARTAKQITEDMNAGHPAVGSPVGTAVGYWKFDEGYGTTANNSGSQGSTLGGSLSGMSSPATSTSGWTNSGKFGKALVFDGTNDFVAMPSDVTALKITSDITLSAWINLTNTSSTHDIICKYTGTAATSAYCLYTDTNGKLNMSVVNETGPAIVTTTGSTTLTAGSWYYVTGVFSSANSVTLYINGAQDKQNTTSIPTTLQNPTTILDIGAENAGSNPFTGTIDEPKVYNYALTADQVKQDMNRNQAQVLGALSDNSSYQVNAANQEYCVPGDSTSCTAPVGEWKFEEGSGNANDTSGNGYTGTPTGTTIVSGKIGKARNFNGTSDYITASAPGITGDSALTIEAWVYRTGSDVSAYPNIVAFGNATSEQAAVLYFRNTGAFAIGTKGGTYAGGTTTSTQNQWFHVAGTYSGSSGTWRIYVNGVQEGNQAESAPLPNIGTTRTSIGVDLGLASQYFAGKVDQVRIFNYARSAAQIAWNYNRGGPVGHWKFDECQGTVANDSSGNGNTGTITPGGAPNASVGTCTASATTMWYNGRTGKYNSSLDFDGTDDYMVTGSFSPLAASGQTTTKVSWGGWFYPTTSAASKTLMEKATEFRIITNSSSQATCGIYYSATFNNSSAASPALTLNAWNQVVCAYDGSNIKTYINGKLADTTANTNSITAASSAFYIGSSSTPNQYFSGQIDDPRIYNYGLTATQIKTLYNDGAVRFGPVTGSP